MGDVYRKQIILNLRGKLVTSVIEKKCPVIAQ